MKDVKILSDIILELSITGYTMGLIDGNIYSSEQLEYYKELKLEYTRRHSI